VLIWPDCDSSAAPVVPGDLAVHRVMALAFDAGARRLGAIGGPTGFLSVYDTANGAVEHRHPLGDRVTHAVLAPDLSLAATASGFDELHVWRPRDGSRAGTIPAQYDEHAALNILAGSGQVAWTMPGGSVHRWEGAAGPLPVLEGGGAIVEQLSSSRDGRVLAALAADGTITVWQLR
jgi:WD40 repeat protein